VTGRLDGKVAVITGAAKGQGFAATRLFTEEGAKVAMLDIDDALVAKAAAEIGSGTLLPVGCDVADSASVQSAVAHIAKEFGQVDILYNNAGTNFRRHGPRDDSQDGPTADVTEALWDLSMGVNLKSVFLMTKYVLPLMLERGSGSIINVTSLAGPFIGAPNHVYAAAKAGVAGLTKALAQTYGEKGIRANAIAPGLIATTMMDRVLNDADLRDMFEKGSPLKRLGQPEDIARVALFLASDESGFMTGSIVVADGGFLIR
jgi:NAD(P)-dependent dehydrogenase (short-subunit alcohol dehydrogenase family)